jgi:hypothetical protein
MTDEQILRLICDHTGKRINLPNFTLDELKDFARAVLAESKLSKDQVKGEFDAWVKEDRIPPIQRKHHLKTWNRAVAVTRLK